MKKYFLFILLMLNISLIGQTKDKFKNLFASETLPKINISTWFGLPAYFHKEDSEDLFSMTLMQTNPYIMPV